MPRALLLIMDGCGDRPVGRLGGKTPLEVARKPVMDRLTAEGCCGLLDVINPGVRPGSDAAHMALLGYDPYKYYPGRGPLEALGAGIEVRRGDVALRANVATVNEDLVVIDRRGGRYVDPGEAAAIEEIINGDVLPTLRGKYGIDAVYKQTVEHRGVLVLRGPVSPMVTDTDPNRVNERVRVSVGLSDEAKLTSEFINEFTRLTHEKLRGAEFNRRRLREGKPPINIVLLRGAGSLGNFVSMRDRYGIGGAVIAGVAVIKGIGRALGMEVIDVPNYVGSRDDDIKGAFIRAAEALGSRDFVMIHVKATDSMSHDRDVDGKINVLERIDEGLMMLMERIPGDTYVVVTCDHSTPVETGDHSGDPVPIMMWGPGVMRDHVVRFSERDCYRGYLGRLRGIDVMRIITDYLGKGEKMGE